MSTDEAINETPQKETLTHTEEQVEHQREPVIPKGKPYIELAFDDNGDTHWVLWSSNGRQMAMNAEPYRRRGDAMKAIAAVKGMIKDARVVQIHS